VSVSIEGAPNCVVRGGTSRQDGLGAGEPVYVGVRPEDVELFPVTGSTLPAGMIGGVAHAALFLGERYEYRIEVDGQEAIDIYGDRHNPLPEGGKVWMKLRATGHSIWPAAQVSATSATHSPHHQH
jgi:hypothetical protein